jgi:hypothetical protein
MAPGPVPAPGNVNSRYCPRPPACCKRPSQARTHGAISPRAPPAVPLGSRKQAANMSLETGKMGYEPPAKQFDLPTGERPWGHRRGSGRRCRQAAAAWPRRCADGAGHETAPTDRRYTSAGARCACTWASTRLATPLRADPDTHKATTIRLWSVSRPHMRAFHLSWLAFFSTFVSTFGPAALITIIREDLDMTKTDIGNAGIAAVCGAIFGRIAFGNFIDVYGTRQPFQPQQSIRSSSLQPSSSHLPPPAAAASHLPPPPPPAAGPRYGVAVITLLTATPVFLIALANSALSFVSGSAAACACSVAPPPPAGCHPSASQAVPANQAAPAPLQILARLFIGFSLCTFVGCQFW